MTTFVFDETVPVPTKLSAALGASTAAKFVDADVGKAVKLGTANNYVPVADGDEIEGFVSSIEPATVNGGFSFGGVQKDGRMTAEVGSGSVSVGTYVVAATPVALGTAGMAKVKAASGAANTLSFLWRVIRITSGAGSAGSVVLLERV